LTLGEKKHKKEPIDKIEELCIIGQDVGDIGISTL
jgi:hypothetical protein